MADDGRRMTIGFPRMRKEPGERRDFLPSLIARLVLHHAEILIEHGVGSGMGLSDNDYTAIGPSVRITSHGEAFEQDIVVVLRCPDPEELDLLPSGTALVSMLHFPTRPERIARLRRAGVEAIALDCITDDAGHRLVEDSRAVGWNALEAAFDALERTYPLFADPKRPPIRLFLRRNAMRKRTGRARRRWSRSCGVGWRGLGR